MRKLSIISWNIWFDTLEQQIRYREVFKVCMRYSPDVICFQEVTMPFLQYLLQFFQESKEFGDQYILSDDLTGRSFHPYGVLTLAKKTLKPSFQMIPFETNMARKLLLTALMLPNNELFVVGNVHLESLNSAPYRQEQLRVSHAHLCKFPHYIICGDFNFCSYRNYNILATPLENDCLPRVLPEGKDMWATLYPTQKGYTFHGKDNDLIPNKTEIMRYDRIMYATLQSKQLLVPERMEILGTEPIVVTSDTTLENNNTPADPFASPPLKSASKTLRVLHGRDLIQVFPSDHYGLFGEFRFDENPNPSSVSSQRKSSCDIV